MGEGSVETAGWDWPHPLPREWSRIKILGVQPPQVLINCPLPQSKGRRQRLVSPPPRKATDNPITAHSPWAFLMDRFKIHLDLQESNHCYHRNYLSVKLYQAELSNDICPAITVAIATGI